MPAPAPQLPTSWQIQDDPNLARTVLAQEEFKERCERHSFERTQNPIVLLGPALGRWNSCSSSPSSKFQPGAKVLNVSKTQQDSARRFNKVRNASEYLDRNCKICIMLCVALLAESLAHTSPTSSCKDIALMEV